MVKVKKRNSKRMTKKKSPVKKKEVGVLGGVLRSLGGLGGGALGSFIGQPGIGASIGTSLGGAVSKWLGAGDYSVSRNSLIDKFKSSGDIPMMHRSGNNIVVRHKEYITDVNSSTGFAIGSSYPLNPGLESSFPWLSTIAQQYQEYTWKGIIYHYIPTAGDAVSSTNNALGSVMLATNYRATASGFTNKQQLLNEFFSSDAKPSEGFCHPIECDPKENPYNVQYVRGGVVPTGEDQKTYDLGVTTIATEGMQASGIDVGELWVSYEVELRKPVVTGSINQYAQVAHYYAASGVSNSTPFGTAIKQYDQIGLTLTSSKITFPLGVYGHFYVSVYFNGVATATLTTWVSGGTLVNCSNDIWTQGSAASNGFYTNTSTGTAAMAACCLKIPDPTVQASFTPAISTLTGASIAEIIVYQIGNLSA